MTLSTSHVREKLRSLESSVHQALLGRGEPVPIEPARDVGVLPPSRHPDKTGFSTQAGRVRLLHDVANIELQAMELGLRGLLDYPDAPEAFRQELAQLTLSEGSHLTMCLDALEAEGGQWGQWPVHLGLWQATAVEDTLLDRILIVHRFLEGSGLDAQDRILERLDGVAAARNAQRVLAHIQREEIGHVSFGSRWYREICRAEKIDPDRDFFARMDALKVKLPKRNNRISHKSRIASGFTMEEIAYLEKWREESLPPASR